MKFRIVCAWKVYFYKWSCPHSKNILLSLILPSFHSVFFLTVPLFFFRCGCILCFSKQRKYLKHSLDIKLNTQFNFFIFFFFSSPIWRIWWCLPHRSRLLPWYYLVTWDYLYLLTHVFLYLCYFYHQVASGYRSLRRIHQRKYAKVSFVVVGVSGVVHISQSSSFLPTRSPRHTAPPARLTHSETNLVNIH